MQTVHTTVENHKQDFHIAPSEDAHHRIYNMGKRRKSAGKPHTTSTSGDVDPSNSKLRIKTYEDVADSEDEFHINRDKILLEEGPARKRQRKQKEDGGS